MKARTNARVAACAAMMCFGWVACEPPEEGARTPVNQVGAPPANTVGTWSGTLPPPNIAPQYHPTPYVPPASPTAPVPTEMECRTRASAAPAVDTSSETDVRQQFAKFFTAHHDTFRCCYDALEAPSKPLVNAKISMLVKIDPTGTLTSAEVLTTESDAVSPQTSKCMTDIASRITYPKPVSGAAVGYNRIFDFKAHR